MIAGNPRYTKRVLRLLWPNCGAAKDIPFGESWYSSSGNEFVFTSYQRDAESGLDYAMARYYDSGSARFCSADPVGGKANDPQTWNRYTYVRNDPIDLTDPSGKFAFIPLLILLAENFLEGMAVDFVSHTIQDQPGLSWGDVEGAALGAALGAGGKLLTYAESRPYDAAWSFLC